MIPADNRARQEQVQLLDYACDNLPYTAIPRVIDCHLAAIAGPRDRITVDLFRHLWDMGRQRGDYTAIASLEQLATRLQTTPSSVRRARTKLQRSGMLHWYSPVRDDGTNERTHWVLKIPKEVELLVRAAAPRQKSASEAAEHATERAAPAARTASTGVLNSAAEILKAAVPQPEPIPPQTPPTIPTPPPESIPYGTESDLELTPHTQPEPTRPEPSQEPASCQTETAHPPELENEAEITGRMTPQERNHFEIMVKLHGHDMRTGLAPDSALTPNDLDAIERYRHEIRRHNAHQVRKMASEGSLKGQVGSCDRRHAEGTQADAQLVREQLSQGELVQAAAIAEQYASQVGIAFLELYRQIVWHLLFNPQSRRSTFHGLRIAQRLLEQGRWGVPRSMRDDFQPPPPPRVASGDGGRVSLAVGEGSASDTPYNPNIYNPKTNRTTLP